MNLVESSQYVYYYDGDSKGSLEEEVEEEPTTIDPRTRHNHKKTPVIPLLNEDVILSDPDVLNRLVETIDEIPNEKLAEVFIQLGQILKRTDPNAN
jgi:hypothetical protein